MKTNFFHTYCFNKNLLLIFFIIIFIITSSSCVLSSCAVCKPKPQIQPIETIYNIKDSTVVHIDSVKVDVPVERYVDVVPYTDTLHLETSVARAIAYADTTTHTIKGKLENKPVSLKKEIVYKDRIVEKEVIKEIPVEVQVEKIVRKNPWYFGIVVFFGVIGLLAIIKIIISLYVKIKTP